LKIRIQLPSENESGHGLDSCSEQLGLDTTLALAKSETILLAGVLDIFVSSGISTGTIAGSFDTLGEVTLVVGSALTAGIGADGSVSSRVHIFKTVSINAVSKVNREVGPVLVLIFFFQLSHVISDMTTKDVMSVLFRIGFIGAARGREVLITVGDVEPSITGTLETTEDTRTTGSTLKSNIEDGLEWTLGIILTIIFLSVDIPVGTINLSDTLVRKFHLGVDTTGKEETSAVRSGVVGQTSLNSEGGKFVRVGGGNHAIVRHISSDNLHDDISVGTAKDHAVLGALVLVLILDDKTLAGIVVRDAFAATTELDLIPLEISLVLNNLDETHD
jgi:hypothetical protein